MFEELPETNGAKSVKKAKAVLVAAAFQVAVVAAIIVVQMAMPEKLGGFQLLTTLYMAPPPPPPPPAPLGPPPKIVHETARPATNSEETAVQQEAPPQPAVEQPQLTAPTTVPQDIAKIIEPGAGAPSAGGVVGGVAGGVAGGQPGGTAGGIWGGVLGGVGNLPPPPAPKAPVRIGGDIRQPKIVKMVEPQYPPEARKAHVEGVVVLEATVTEKGIVENVKVISGPPLLTEPAAKAVQQWKYEPTILNGQPVPVILTARVNFSLAGAGK